ncbi:MAG TPA: YggT family protein [Candidatus Dormibacteraeota bacterium]
MIVDVLIYALYALLIVILIRVALSWISPYPTNDFSRVIYRITDPILLPIRRRMPPVSGLDLSPLVVTLAILFVIAALRSIS